MYIKTKYFGEVEIEVEQKWSFPRGLPGFEEEKEFALISIEENTAFQILQSTGNSEIALIVSNPYLFVDDFTFDIDEPTANLLEIKELENIFVLGVLSIKEPFGMSTINLQAPIVFNTKTNRAKQMIINDSRFPIRYRIDSESNRTVGGLNRCLSYPENKAK